MTNETLGRGPHSPHTKETAAGQSAALLVDFDNVTLGIRSDIQQQLKLIMNSDVFRGKISVHRAYADWRRYPQYIVPLSEASFDLIFAPAFGASKKNATDIRLAIDAVELVFVRPEIGTYILLSGDSDFSSLVLKLKEYGKYVIGIGILESASDLLIQNCDEYYSYGELTGFTRVADEADAPSRDPWGLVVDAVVRMKERGDVMRSDRLKQVMQELDGQFTEKNAGFNKFSRFVIEASKRGLLVASKLQNGQYEIDLGNDANVEPEVEAKLSGASTSGAKETSGRPMNLSEAFDALKKVLRASTSEGDEPVDSDTVRQRLIDDAGPNPVFTGQRYNRLLRQAHDAELIELTKAGDGYRLRLSPSFRGEEKEDTSARPAKTRVRKKPRAPARGDTKEEPGDRSEPDGSHRGDGEDGEEKAPPRGGRSHSKSRDDRKTASAENKSEAGEKTAAPAATAGEQTPTRPKPRGMGPRTSARSRSRREANAEHPDAKRTPPNERKKDSAPRVTTAEVASEPKTPPARDAAQPAEARGPTASKDRAQAGTRSGSPAIPTEGDGGFLKRVSAVVQKAIRGDDGSDE